MGGYVKEHRSQGRKRVYYRITGVFLLCGFLALFAVGCSKKDRPQKGKPEITFMYYGSPEQIRRVENNVVEFRKKNPDIAVRAITMQLSDEYRVKILTMFAGKTPPDVMYLTDRIYLELAQRGLFLDLTKYLSSEEIKRDRWFKPLVSLCSDRNGVSALPIYCSPYVIHYNTYLFKKYGLPTPGKNWTWKDFLNSAKKLTVRDNKGRTIQYGYSANSRNIDFIAPFLFSNGSEFDQNGYFYLGIPGKQERNIEAIQFYLDLIYKYHVAPQANEAEGKNSLDMFLQDQVGMFTAWFEATEYLLDHSKDSKNWDIVEFPSNGTKSTNLHATVAVVGAGTRYPKESAELAAFLMGSPERAMPPFDDDTIQKQFFEKAGVSSKNYQAYINSMKYAKTIPALDSEHFAIFATELDLMWIGKKSARETFATATQSIRKVNNERNKPKPK